MGGWMDRRTDRTSWGGGTTTHSIYSGGSSSSTLEGIKYHKQPHGTYTNTSTQRNTHAQGG